MVVEVFNCAAKITGGKMAIILGTAIAITAFSACIAPLLQCQDDDDSKESKKTLAQNTGIVEKPQSSLMTIFLNGLRKIGVISPPIDNETHENQSAQGSALCSCLPPVVPVIEASKIQGNGPENVRKPVHDFVDNPVQVLEERNNNVVQRVNIKLILSRSTQSTQTEDDDFESARGIADITDSSAITEDSLASCTVPDPRSLESGTQAESLITEDRPSRTQISHTSSAIKHPTLSAQAGTLMTDEDRSLMTDESSTSSVVPDLKPSAIDTQRGAKHVAQVPVQILIPRIPKPPRAHPPGQFLVGAQVHQDASVSDSNQIQSHNESIINQTSSDRPSDYLEMKTTPTGRFHAASSHHHSLINENHRNYSSTCSHASPSMTPSSETKYPLHLPEPKSWKTQGPRPSEGRITDSPGSLVTKLRKLITFFQTSELRHSGNSSRNYPDMTTVQTNPSDHSSHIRRLHLAETLRPSSVIQDLENERSMEPYSNSDLLLSPRVPNASSTMASIAEEISSYPRGLPNTDSRCQKVEVNREGEEDTLKKCTRNLMRDLNLVNRNKDAYLDALRRSKNHLLPSDDQNAINQCPEHPSRPPELLRCDNQPDSRTNISDAGTDYSILPRRKKSIAGKFRDFFRRRGKGKNQSTFTECDTTFDRTVNWNLMGQL